MALENQRYGRNKGTLVNHSYIESGEYRRKFDSATENPVVNKALYDCAKAALKHRSGTVFEDMYWIDSSSGNTVLAITDSITERGILYTDRIGKIVKRHSDLITIHTHPGSMPPSISDFNSCCENGYKMGFVACHNGKVFAYTSNQMISKELYEIYVGDFIVDGYDEYTAQILTLEKLKNNHKINFWEVKEHV